MRLIDAEKIVIKPEMMFDMFGCAMIRVEDVARLLCVQPTAYDVDKVVERLEDQQNVNRYENHHDEWNVGLDQAIEIVKRGGIDE